MALNCKQHGNPALISAPPPAFLVRLSAKKNSSHFVESVVDVFLSGVSGSRLYKLQGKPRGCDAVMMPAVGKG